MKVGTADEVVGIGSLIILGLLAIFGWPSYSTQFRRAQNMPAIVHQDGPKDDSPTPEQPAPKRDEPRSWPPNPDDLLKEGWVETSDPNATANGRRTFVDPETGEEVTFDKGRPGQPGFEGQDHYHRVNPGAIGKRDAYLDEDGNPVPRGSKRSHITPGTR